MNVKEALVSIMSNIAETTEDFGDYEQCKLDTDDAYWLVNKVEELQEKVERYEKHFGSYSSLKRRGENMKTNCVYCDSKIDTEKDKYSVGESLGEYWCEECLSTGSDER